jgi:hypothetical protein
MSVIKDEHALEIEGQSVVVTGTTASVHAIWKLLIEGEEADTAKAAGDFTLKGSLSGGSPIEAAVHQSLVGPTEIVIRHGGEAVKGFKGFVA